MNQAYRSRPSPLQSFPHPCLTASEPAQSRTRWFFWIFIRVFLSIQGDLFLTLPCLVVKAGAEDIGEHPDACATRCFPCPQRSCLYGARPSLSDPAHAMALR